MNTRDQLLVTLLTPHSTHDSHEATLALVTRLRLPLRLMQLSVPHETLYLFIIRPTGPGHNHLLNHRGEGHLLRRGEAVRCPKLRREYRAGQALRVKIGAR